MPCTHKDTCPLFPQFRTAALRLWQIHYCDADYQKCARFKGSCDGTSVPLTLLPDGTHLQLPTATKKP